MAADPPSPCSKAMQLHPQSQTSETMSPEPRARIIFQTVKLSRWMKISGAKWLVVMKSPNSPAYPSSTRAGQGPELENLDSVNTNGYMDVCWVYSGYIMGILLLQGPHFKQSLLGFSSPAQTKLSQTSPSPFLNNRNAVNLSLTGRFGWQSLLFPSGSSLTVTL